MFPAFAGMTSEEQMQKKPNALPWLSLSAIVIVLDQLSKLWVLRHLPEFQPVPVMTLAVVLARTARGDWKTALPFALVIGGAIGNVIDRIQHGHVIDFIQWYWQDHFWPAFNIADSAIVAGAVGIALFGLLQGKPAKPAS